MSRPLLIGVASLLASGALVHAQGTDHAGHRHHDASRVNPPPHDHSQHAHDHAARTEQTESQLRHVPPPPPQNPLPDMSNNRMIELMDMNDNAPFAAVMLEEIEARRVDARDVFAWDAFAWFGTDYTKAWLTSEGSRVRGDTEMRNELLVDRIASRWWNLRAGVRHDTAHGPSRTWAAVGVQGLAPYGYEVEAFLYVGEQGRTAGRLAVEGDWLLTQRLVLQPEIELDFYGKEDVRNAIGSGLSTSEIALRLRYEVRREFAPYVGVLWSRAHAGTADALRARGQDDTEVSVVAGFRIWF